jgi:hypothetical protein
MRSLALTALLGSFIASTSLVGQSLTEHAAAAAGATVGTAAGKPLGTALGGIFGAVDKSTSAAANPKTTKPVVIKPSPVAPAAAPIATGHPSVGVGGGGDVAAGGSGGASHHVARRKVLPEEPQLEPVAPIAPVAAAPVVEIPVIKEPTAQDVAGIKVGATSSELREALGAPESMVSIPGDDGHLLEICQYWAKGEAVGTIRLDNGRVVSVQTNN